MNNKIKTELVFEVAQKLKNQSGYEKRVKKFSHNIEKVEIKILTDEISKKIGRDKGKYVSLNFDDMLFFDVKAKKILTEKLSSLLEDFFELAHKKISKILVVGLGNEKYICDSLGKMVSQNVVATEPYILHKLFDETKLRRVYSISMGVYGTTGLDTTEVIKSICNYLKPDFVVAIDSLVASKAKALCTSIQVSDTKLTPGGGVGNERKEVSFQTIGFPVFAIGVPLVLNMEKDGEDLVVTPKDVDSKVKILGKIIAESLNFSLNNLTKDEWEGLVE